MDELLMLEEGHCLRDHTLPACKIARLSQPGAFQGTSLHTLIQMVAGGQGVTFLPELALVWRGAYHRKDGLRTLADATAGRLTGADGCPTIRNQGARR